MPGKLPGGKVRISQTAPSIIKKTKNPATSEVQYFGLVRDLYLEDLTSNKDALEQVLEDVQDPAERKAEGPMKIGDLSIIDGIVNFDLKTEDLEILGGASLTDEEGGTLVNPRYRLSDRISQFASFSGRGYYFDGSGPVKFSYFVPKEGDLLPGTVSIASNGTVTGVDTYFSDESSLPAEQQLNRTLSVGDFVVLYEADGITKHRTGATDAIKKADECVYKVTAISSNNTITVEPTPGNTVSGGKKLRKRYCHNRPAPFFTEAINSTKFNAPDTFPTSSNYQESHRKGFMDSGVFKPLKEFESWWEGKYNHDMRDRDEYGTITDDADNNPKYPIVKDGNINFELTREDFSQSDNFGVRYDFWMRTGFSSGDLFAKFKAQVNGQLKIDYFEQTGYDSSGAATGTWKNAIDTTDTLTFFRQIKKEAPANNRLQKREVFLQGGPDFGSAAEAQSRLDSDNDGLLLGDLGALNLSFTYNDEEGNAKNRFRNHWVPVVVRYWFGQDTIDNSTTNPISDLDSDVSAYSPSFALDIDGSSVTSDNLKYWNNYFGFLKLQWNSTDSNWDIVSTSLPANYDVNADEFYWQFEVLAYTALNEASPPDGPTSKNMDSWIAKQIEFGNIPSEVLVAERFFDGTDYVNNKLDLTIDGITPTTSTDVIYIMAQNRPDSINLKTVTAPITTYSRSNREMFTRLMFNPDPIGNYNTIGDMLAGGANFVEPNPLRNEFEDNPEYFQYKHGVKPLLNTYGPSRYDGFIPNQISSSYDDDYAHSKVLPIGRQKKATASTEPTTGNNVPDPKPLDTVTNETRTGGENYTFISVEEDEAGNGGNVSLVGYPVSTLASIATTTAGLDQGGKLLDAADNSTTFSNGNRQNITDISLEYLPTDTYFDDNTDANDTFDPAKGYSINYETVNNNAIKFLYPAKYSTDPSQGEAFDATTRGMISSLSLGVTTGRTKANKSVFIALFEKMSYINGIDLESADKRYFLDFLLATRPNAEKEINIAVVDEIIDSDLFSNFDSNLTNLVEANRLYNGALIEFYANSDDLANSATPVAICYVDDVLDIANNQVSYVVDSGTAPTAGNHFVRVYYNYFEITKQPAKNTDENGTVGSISFSEGEDGSTMQIGFVYNASYGLSKADNGGSLSFAETLYVAENPNAVNPSLAPFSGDTELPSPPSVTVTPFDFDNQPTNPSDPGLGGLCYPPYQTQDVDLKTTIANDSTLYNLTNNPVGNHDVYFGSPQASLTDLGNKSLQVTDEFAFDFSVDDRPRIIPTDVSGYSFPTFSASSYTHKLRVNLNPFIGNPIDNTGLFTQRGDGDYTSVVNKNIFNDALVHSNNKPVKETFFLFAKKSDGTGEQPISILVDNDPGYT